MSTFSIITVARNNLAGLKKTGESIANQSSRDFEWIVIDGGSDDGSASWLRATEAKWISEPDGGIYDAMNKGIAMAHGDFVMFMNAGDIFATNDVLEKIKNVLAAQKEMPGFVYGDSLETADGFAVEKPARCLSKIRIGMPTHHQAMLYRRQAIGNLRFDTKYRIAADHKFTAQFLKTAGEALRLPFPVCIFESGGVSQQHARQGRQEIFRVRKELALCGPAENLMLYMLQSAVMALRRAFPGFYWKLRQSCGNSAGDPAPAQNPGDRRENQA